jgi:hypothetical protein
MTDEVQSTAAPSAQPTSEQLNDLRARVLAGQEVSVDEYRILITSLRAQRSGDLERGNAAKRAGAPKSLTPKAKVELPSLFDDL